MEELIDDIPEEKPNFRFKKSVLSIWTILIVLGVLFYFKNWPGKRILVLFTSAGFSAYAFSGFLTFKGSHILNTICTIISLCWLLVMLFGVFFNNGNPFNQFGLILYIIILVAFTTFYEIIKYYKFNSKA